MATSTTRLSLRKPEPTDTVNVTTDIGGNMDVIDREMGMEVRSDFPVSPYNGKIVYRSDLGKSYVYQTPSWREFVLVENIMSPQQVSDTTQVSTTSTTFVVGNPVVSITFNAPASGAVYVTVGGACEASSPVSAAVTYQMRETDANGTVVQAANDERSFGVQDQFWVRGCNRSIVSGLTPGQQYFVRTMHRVSGSGTATIFARSLMVEPVLNWSP